LAGFLKYATVPIVNMEGCTGHPLQALADVTIEEFKRLTVKSCTHGLRIPEHYHRLSPILL
jgi:ornithine carbamoyltransferase